MWIVYDDFIVSCNRGAFEVKVLNVRSSSFQYHRFLKVGTIPMATLPSNTTCTISLHGNVFETIRIRQKIAMTLFNTVHQLQDVYALY